MSTTSLFPETLGPRRYLDELTDEEWNIPEIRDSAVPRPVGGEVVTEDVTKYLGERNRVALRQAESLLTQATMPEVFGLEPDEAAELEAKAERQMNRLLNLAFERRDRQRVEARRLKRPSAKVIPLRPARQSASRSRASRTARRAAGETGGARDGPSGDDGEPEPPGDQKAAGRRTRIQYAGSMASVNGSSDREARAAFEKIVNLHARLLRCGDGHS